MNYTIQNEMLKVTISSFGAEIQSIQTKDKKEWLWQGDKSTWEDHAPNLFPYIGRLVNKTYQYKNKTYTMNIHGFVKYMDLKIEYKDQHKIVFSLESNEETKKAYPFDFIFYVQYVLDGNTLNYTYKVKNKGEQDMFFGLGAHPGFQVPFNDKDQFEDYCIEFEEGVTPNKIIFSKDCFVTDKKQDFILRDGKYIDLTHEMFKDDAIVLENSGHKVTLKSNTNERQITVCYPNMDYLGIWQWPNTTVPYVCIEPWSSLPARENIIEDIELQENLIVLQEGNMYENSICISIL